MNFVCFSDKGRNDSFEISTLANTLAYGLKSLRNLMIIEIVVPRSKFNEFYFK